MANEVNIVIKALNKATPIFTRIKDDAIKMVQGISGRSVAINTASAKKGLTEIGKGAKEAKKEVEGLANTSLDKLIAGFTKLKGLLVGGVIAGGIGVAINKVMEFRDAFLMGAEKASKGEVEFTRKIKDAAKEQIDAKMRVARAGLAARKDLTLKERADEEARIGIEGEREAVNESVSSKKAELADATKIAAVIEVARKNMTGLGGSFNIVAAQIGKTVDEVAELFIKGGGTDEDRMMMDKLLPDINSDEVRKEIAEVQRMAEEARTAAKEGRVWRRPTTEKNERAAQERIAGVGLLMEEVDAAEKRRDIMGLALDQELTNIKASNAEEEKREKSLERIAELEASISHSIENATKEAEKLADIRAAQEKGVKVPPNVQAMIDELAPRRRPVGPGAVVAGKLLEGQAARIMEMNPGVSREEALKQAGKLAQGKRKFQRVDAMGREVLRGGEVVEADEAERRRLEAKNQKFKDTKGVPLSAKEAMRFAELEAMKNAKEQLRKAEEAKNDLALEQKAVGLWRADLLTSSRNIELMLLDNLTAR